MLVHDIGMSAVMRALPHGGESGTVRRLLMRRAATDLVMFRAVCRLPPDDGMRDQ